MKVTTLLEILTAAHLTAHVDAEHFPERGGIMLVGPPGNLKSTLTSRAFRAYVPQAIVMSDINVDTLNRMHDRIAAKQITTLAFPSFEKIYERNPQTASNIEGHIKAYADEGFMEASFRDQRMIAQAPAQCLIVGAMVKSCYRDRFTKWDEAGFIRRFIWSSFHLDNQEIMTDSIHRWERLEIEMRVPTVPVSNIKMTVTPEESTEIRKLLMKQNCETLPYALMKKILAVLKWKYRKPEEAKKPMQIIRDFSTSLGQQMAKLTVDKELLEASFSSSKPKAKAAAKGKR